MGYTVNAARSLYSRKHGAINRYLYRTNNWFDEIEGSAKT